jgi:hypothetical protein
MISHERILSRPSSISVSRCKTQHTVTTRHDLHFQGCFLEGKPSYVKTLRCLFSFNLCGGASNNCALITVQFINPFLCRQILITRFNLQCFRKVTVGFQAPTLSGPDKNKNKNKNKTQWLESASELYRPSDRHLSTKLGPICCG